MIGWKLLHGKERTVVLNSSPAASHVFKPTEKPREFQREREKEEQKNQSEVQPQAYLGEEDQLRPSSPLVCLGKLWSPSLSQYLIRTLRCGALLVPSCPFSLVQEELKSCPSQFQDCSLGESRQKMR
ncbi:hypothetical protein IGI04_002674 [Brassica rapa subsp. trilocularis]|uniref:Uncharacterized protein n=1 Tax=Brassica rapa subsp. trilocularis TaxID=1813537 RepID=A0ABQ7NW71_BRACM|nr:hypothetical protein IGI04_002674 [Brassica rapa subsp. trilocularis]